MSKRYKIDGDWRHRAGWYGDNDRHVIVEQTDLVDTHSGRHYSGGAYRVLVRNIEGYRTKVFKGECAWMDAARLARDACPDWRWDPDL